MKHKGKRSDYHENSYRRETTRDERIKVITLRDHAGMKWTEIASKLNIPQSTCKTIYQRAKEHGSPSNRRRTGRNPSFTDEEKEELRLFVTRDKRTRRLAWELVCEEMGYACSADTVKKMMQSMGYNKRVARREVEVTAINKEKRVKWCRERLHWTYDDWFRIVWINESSFSTSDYPYRLYVTRTDDEEYHPDCLDEHSGKSSVTVWGAFCGALKSELYFVPDDAKLDSEKYVENVLDPILIPFWHKTCEEYGWTQVVEDGAPCHNGAPQACRELNQIETLTLPPQSPDLNLIEALWADLECELEETYGKVGNTETQRLVFEMAWKDVGAERLDGLIKSMPQRLEKVIKAGGAAAAY